MSLPRSTEPRCRLSPVFYMAFYYGTIQACLYAYCPSSGTLGQIPRHGVAKRGAFPLLPSSVPFGMAIRRFHHGSAKLSDACRYGPCWPRAVIDLPTCLNTWLLVLVQNPTLPGRVCQIVKKIVVTNLDWCINLWTSESGSCVERGWYFESSNYPVSIFSVALTLVFQYPERCEAQRPVSEENGSS